VEVKYMRTKVMAVILVLLLICLAACKNGAVSQDEYDKLVSEMEDLRAELRTEREINENISSTNLDDNQALRDLVENPDQPTNEENAATQPTTSPGLTPDNSDQQPHEVPSEQPESSPPPADAQSIVITYANSPVADFTEPIGARIPLNAKIGPVGVVVDEPIKWESSNTEIFEVVPVNPEGTAATVSIIGTVTAPDGALISNAILTASIGGMKYECIVRVRS
jgi:hypothetical protein